MDPEVVHKSPPVVHVINQISLVYTTPSLLFLVVSSLLKFLPIPHIRSSSPHSCYMPAHLILLYLIILIIFGEE
jgi:hypothetical protein